MKLDFSRLSQPAQKTRGQVRILGTSLFATVPASPGRSQHLGPTGDEQGASRASVPSVPDVSPNIGDVQTQCCRGVPAVPNIPAQKTEDYVGGIMLMSAYPMADGPFTPWCLPTSPERLSNLRVDLQTAIGKVADIEGCTEDRRAHLLGLVARQPIPTLADDLAYFRERLHTIEDGGALQKPSPPTIENRRFSLRRQ